LSAGDSLRYQEGGDFSTPDQDSSKGRCTKTYKGSWWFGLADCHQAFLNAPYKDKVVQTEDLQGILWLEWKDKNYSLKSTEMKMRPYKKTT